MGWWQDLWTNPKLKEWIIDIWLDGLHMAQDPQTFILSWSTIQVFFLEKWHLINYLHQILSILSLASQLSTPLYYNRALKPIIQGFFPHFYIVFSLSSLIYNHACMNVDLPFIYNQTALKKVWERWEMKMLREDCEKSWEIKDEDRGCDGGIEKDCGMRDEDGRRAVLRDEDWKTWTIKVESEDGVGAELRGKDCERWVAARV